MKINSQHPRNKQDRGGELKPCVACDQMDNGSPADAFSQKRSSKMRINDIIFFFITIFCGKMIKDTIKEEHPKEYKQAMKEAPLYLRIGEKLT